MFRGLTGLRLVTRAPFAAGDRGSQLPCVLVNTSGNCLPTVCLTLAPHPSLSIPVALPGFLLRREPKFPSVHTEAFTAWPPSVWRPSPSRALDVLCPAAPRKLLLGGGDAVLCDVPLLLHVLSHLPGKPQVFPANVYFLQIQPRQSLLPSHTYLCDSSHNAISPFRICFPE